VWKSIEGLTMKPIILLLSVFLIAMTKMGNCQTPILAQPYEDVISPPVSNSLANDISVDQNKELGYGAYDPSVKPLYITPSTSSSLPGLQSGGIGPIPAFKSKTLGMLGISPSKGGAVLPISSSSSWIGSDANPSDRAAFVAGALEQVRQIPSNSGSVSVSSWVAGNSAFVRAVPGESLNNLPYSAIEGSSPAQLFSMHQGYLSKEPSLLEQNHFLSNTMMFSKTVSLGKATTQLPQQLMHNEFGHIPGVSETEQISTTEQPGLPNMTNSPSSEVGQIPGADLSAGQDNNALFDIDTTLSAPEPMRAVQPYIARFPTKAGMEIRLVQTKDGLQLVLESKDPLTGSILADQSGVSAPPEGWWSWSAGSGNWVPTEEKNTLPFRDPSDTIARRLLKASQPSEEKPTSLKRLSPDDVE
jgi:hypothetical protein